FGRGDGEACGLVVVERAPGFKFLAGLLQDHALANQGNKVGLRQEVIHEGIGQSGHGRSPGHCAGAFARLLRAWACSRSLIWLAARSPCLTCRSMISSSS